LYCFFALNLKKTNYFQNGGIGWNGNKPKQALRRKTMTDNQTQIVTIRVDALQAAQLMAAFKVGAVEVAIRKAIAVAVAASEVANQGDDGPVSRTCQALIRGVSKNSCG
jgi:hypothetical protein